MKTLLSIVLWLAGTSMVAAQSTGAIANLSTRGIIGPGSSGVTTGFVIEGSAPKSVLVRGVGPGLAAFGVTGAVAADQITVYDANGNIIAQNDGYLNDPNASANSQIAAQVGAFALADPGDSATVVSLPPGAYTVTAALDASTNIGGQVMIEVYDADGPGAASTITNLSSLGSLGSESGPLISGFTISGDTAHDLILRGVGPDLGSFGISDPAAAVGFQIMDADGNLVASSAAMPQQSADSLDDDLADMGAFPTSNPGDSLVAVTLAPGAYTIEVFPSSGDTSNSVGLLEVYDTSSLPLAQ